jgi:hypothetical protein
MDKYAIRMEICLINKLRFMITISKQQVILHTAALAGLAFSL